MKIEVFYIEGCPNHAPTVERIKAMLQDLEVAGELVESVVDDSTTVAALRFLGSPTVQINGIDVEPSARTSNQFGYMCRTYANGPSQEGIPSRQLIRAAMLETCK